jgi:hypothetical protein
MVQLVGGFEKFCIWVEKIERIIKPDLKRAFSIRVNF